MKLFLNERDEYYQSWPGEEKFDSTVNQTLKKVCKQVYGRWTPKVGQPDGCCKLKARR
jgi:hypothetical protein